MPFLWAGLAILYTINCTQLIFQKDFGGALIVGAIAVAFCCLSWRSFQKKKYNRENHLKNRD